MDQEMGITLKNRAQRVTKEWCYRKVRRYTIDESGRVGLGYSIAQDGVHLITKSGRHKTVINVRQYGVFHSYMYV